MKRGGLVAYRAAARVLFLFLPVLYILLALGYYRNPYRYLPRLYQDLRLARSSLMGRTSFMRLMPSDYLLRRWQTFKLVFAGLRGENFLRRAAVLESRGVGFFTFFLPAILWIRIVYLGFFLIPPVLMWFAYLERLWHLKMTQVFITHWILQVGFSLLGAFLNFLFLFFLVFPAVPASLCVALAWLWPPVQFARDYYSGAWLWRKREV